MVEFNDVVFQKIGITIAKLDKDTLQEIKDLVINRRHELHKDAKPTLVGALKEEKEIPIEFLPDNFKQILQDGLVAHVRSYVNGIKTFDINCLGVWVNYQEKGDYNPLHEHSGDLVFVLWIKVPFNIHDEREYPSIKNSKAVSFAAGFGLVYHNPFGNLTQEVLPVDKDWEGSLVIFNSKFSHLVYPFFTSDDVRISMSGNFSLINVTRTNTW